MKNEISIANDILLAMSKELEGEQLQQLSEVLSTNLKDCVCINDHKRCDTMELTWEVFDRYLEFKATYKTSDKTIIAYKNCIYAFLCFLDKPLFNINEDDIRAYLKHKSNTVSSVSVNNIRRILSSFLLGVMISNIYYIILAPKT